MALLKGPKGFNPKSFPACSSGSELFSGVIESKLDYSIQRKIPII